MDDETIFKKMLNKTKLLIAGTALAIGLNSGATNAQDWAKVKASLNAEDSHALYIVEGGVNLTDKISMYGFIDAEASQKDKIIPNNIYGEARVTYKLNDYFRAIAEHNDGTDYVGTTRLGVAITPKLSKDNFTFVKLFPIETSGKKGPQVSVFTSQSLTDKVEASLLVDYNTKPGTLYIEPTLSYKLNDEFEGFIQLRSFGKPKETKFTPFIGMSYSF